MKTGAKIFQRVLPVAVLREFQTGIEVILHGLGFMQDTFLAAGPWLDQNG
jgi:hypothetical protein